MNGRPWREASLTPARSVSVESSVAIHATERAEEDQRQKPIKSSASRISKVPSITFWTFHAKPPGRKSYTTTNKHANDQIMRHRARICYFQRPVSSIRQVQPYRLSPTSNCMFKRLAIFPLSSRRNKSETTRESLAVKTAKHRSFDLFQRPRYFAGVMIGQIGNMACSRGRNSSFNRRVRLPARLDAVKEISHVWRRPVFKALFS
jgi:hypothetical protein